MKRLINFTSSPIKYLGDNGEVITLEPTGTSIRIQYRPVISDDGLCSSSTLSSLIGVPAVKNAVFIVPNDVYAAAKELGYRMGMFAKIGNVRKDGVVENFIYFA